MLAKLVAGSLVKSRASVLPPSYLLQKYFSTDTDSHDDFKPKVKAAAGGSVEDQIQKAINSNVVHVFMKGTPDMPQCGFSRMACVVLHAYGVDFGSTNVLADSEVREGVKKFTSWPTIPQVFIKGEFIGGSDILMGMHDSGELEKVLTPIREQQAQARQAAKGAQ